jgi:hypothetical protein
MKTVSLHCINRLLSHISRIVKLATHLSLVSKLRMNRNLYTCTPTYAVMVFTARTLKLISCPDILVWTVMVERHIQGGAKLT